jgi:Co/Zn/Cd efflux system component
MERSQFFVARMDCAAEEQLVRLRLADVPGVGAVAVDLSRRTVAVQHHGDPGEITAALEALGLGATPLEPGDAGAPGPGASEPRQRRALVTALAINAVFFVGELVAGILARSMGLIADSLDMLADASVYGLSLVAVGRTAASKKRVAAASGVAQLALAGFGLVEVVRRAVTAEVLPDARTMIIVSALALGANIATLLVLRPARSDEAHIQASWIFTSNDIKVNGLVIVAAVLVSITGSGAADLIAGGIIFVVVANGARRILQLSR